MASNYDLFRAARALLINPKHWTQGAFARDIRGNECGAGRREAACWCLYGALIRASLDIKHQYLYESATKTLDQISQGKNFVSWNDKPERTHGEVIHLLDRAMEASNAQV